jgi:hypothetical protein
VTWTHEAGPVTIKTVQDALHWIEKHVVDDPKWARTRLALQEALTIGSLRKVRAATRAFEEAVGRYN